MRREVILTRLGGRSREPGQAQLAQRPWALANRGSQDRRTADSNLQYFLKEESYA